jgi:hypothetical protein
MRRASREAGLTSPWSGLISRAIFCVARFGAEVIGDANQDDNSSNDALLARGLDSFIAPNSPLPTCELVANGSLRNLSMFSTDAAV